MADVSFPPGLAVAAVSLGDVTLSYQAQVALSAGNHQIMVPLPAARSGNVITARPVGTVPDGYDIGAAFCNTDGQIVVIISHPALTLLQTFTVNVRVFKIMS